MQSRPFLARIVRRASRAFVAVLASAAFVAPLAHADSAPLKVGIATSPQIEALKVAAKEAKAQGLDVKIIEFTDWNTPNAALANEDIDVNYFQHIPFLENAKQQGGYDFVAIANDPVNGRLLLQQRAELVKLRPGADYRATTRDIVANPKHLKIVPLEASQLARTLDDVYLAQGYPSFIKLAGAADPNSALLFDGVENKLSALQWVVRPERVDDPRIRKFISIYPHSPAIRKAPDNAFGSLYAVAW
ncbi:methionine ABC transporter substrate-binding protein [Burkholderia mayonis]|uniref:Methionine ABC transporter substrate-binding protein n=1 Tax=Burkholderia mayonis TaxID=1385591 RepID=A0A1B4FJY3_9BURK|nr:MetQ/NlpA family ABC transporter substrate-binding protein [Burkholderia mayonis]AOJ03986.1 methionine ABC transporter substrate-binding protein [Burkholderia mayonis]KVE49222.1 methionine ABC transporter substrate-binding protein [Burkholderia mayonis]